jgi:drug/metabolite transporter (DMT)-like permease
MMKAERSLKAHWLRSRQQLNNTLILSYLALVVGIITLGFSAIFVRWAEAPGPVTSFYRMAIAVVILAWPFWRRMQKLGWVPWREIGVAVFGGFLFAGDLALWTTGVVFSGATNPTLLANTAPLWVGLGALLFFRERLPAPFWAGLILAMAGAAVILGLDALREVSLGLGTLMGLLAGVFYGGYFLVTQRGRQQLDSLTYTWIAAASSSVFLFLLVAGLRQPFTGYPVHTYTNFLALGLLVQVFGYLAISYALGHLPASLVAPIMLGQPVVTAVLAGPLLGEKLGPLQIMGGVAVLAGVYIVHRSRQATVHPPGG